MNTFEAKNIYSIAGSTLMDQEDIIFMDDDQCYNLTKGISFSVGDPMLFRHNYLQSYDSTIDETTYLNKEESKTEKSINQIQELLNNMLTTYIKKNHDYGNSFEQSLDEEGLAAARIRMGDKWNRFKQLSKGEEALVKDESIKDTLLDLALYAVMTVNWLNNGK